MALLAVLLAFVAFVGLGLGLVFTLMPVWGLVFSFGAPVVALLGIVLGGLAMSAANKRGESSGFALASVIMNVLAFLPALVVAMTCGLCNACVTQQGGSGPQLRMMLPPQTQIIVDAGTPAPPPFPMPDAGAQPTAAPVPDMPPPPMAPGPTR